MNCAKVFPIVVKSRILVRSCSQECKGQAAQVAGASARPEPDPARLRSDMVGPADPLSNLRPLVLRRPDGETPLQKQYRETRMQVHDWNHKFWRRHNTNFIKERDEYLKMNLPDGQQTLTADEMSVFYKSFLDKNWKSHFDYNIEWYKRNIKLLGLAIRVKINRLFKK